ncbi:unnamed protein product [Dibothriocephalus latus]|uniref:Cadherin domain-containing protein n=1 Tax=Dibothriocephalus latus TaxID=60516 RepID=A0A3P6P8U8_DIBLA|nr:unnamed protein product [Dibothriocephalus latus]
MTEPASFVPLALYSIVEETPGPQTLGDLLPLLTATESISSSGANASHLSAIVFFPSTQPFSEYFQLQRRTRTEHGREFLTACYLNLQKSIDLEDACKIRIYGQDCAKTTQAAMRGRTCCCDTSLLFCSFQLQLAMIGGHSNLPTVGLFSPAQRQQSFPVFLVEVRIFDVNENTPTYSQSEYSLRITEGRESRTSFQLPPARDADMGENGRITYLLGDMFAKSTKSADWQRCPNCSSVFHLIQKPVMEDPPNSQGLLYLQVNGELDRERRNAYRLLVLAKDAGRPTQKTGTLHVLIEVLDSNDMKPEFSCPVYNLQIEENVPRGTFVGRFEAKDRDVGVNARVSYSLRPKPRGLSENPFYPSVDTNTPFSINAVTGVITVNGSLDRERKAAYSLYVEATDHGSPARSSESIVHITVLDMNDNSPRVAIRTLKTAVQIREVSTGNTNAKEIREFEIMLPENLPVDEDLAEIDAFDPDAGSNGSVACALPSDIFAIKPVQPASLIVSGAADNNSTAQSYQITKYHLQLSEPIDFERQQFYRLVLTCYDSGTPFQRSTRNIINVFISDENDNPPVLGRPEVIKPAWKVEKSVLDSWKGDKPEFMDSLEEILAKCHLLICLPKRLAINQPFLRIPATDRDTENNAKLEYRLSVFENSGFENEPYHAELFEADTLTGHIFLKRNLDFMQQTRLLKVTLTVGDLGLPSLNTNMDFYTVVTHENLNAPSIQILNFGLIGSLSPFQEVDVSSESNGPTTHIPFYIPKVRKFGMVIGQIQATDKDAGLAGKISFDFSFKSAVPEDTGDCLAKFRDPVDINNSSGVLSIGAGLVTDFNKCRTLATVTAWDQGLPQKMTKVILNFQEFDLTTKFPTLRLNEQFLVSQNQRNLVECAQWIKTNGSFEACASTLDYNLPLLQNDNDTSPTTSTDLPFTFLTVDNERIPGLSEVEIEVENCSSAEYSPLTGSFNFSASTGQLHLIRHLNATDSNQSETLHLVMTDAIWPSVPPTVLRVSVQSGSMDANCTHFRVTLTVGVTAKTECPRSVDSKNVLDGTTRKSDNFKMYMLAVWAIVCILCILLFFQTIILKRTRRHLLHCRRFFRTSNKKAPLPSLGLVYEGKCEPSKRSMTAEESPNNTRTTNLKMSGEIFY